jgi:hypothetical protein
MLGRTLKARPNRGPVREPASMLSNNNPKAYPLTRLIPSISISLSFDTLARFHEQIRSPRYRQIASVPHGRDRSSAQSRVGDGRPERS